MVLDYYFSPLRYKIIITIVIFKIMSENIKMVLKLPLRPDGEKARDQSSVMNSLKKSGMSLITFYDKLRKDSLQTFRERTI